MSRHARWRLALGVLTVIVVIETGPAGLDLYGRGWLLLAAALTALCGLAAGAWPWFVEQANEMRERAAEASAQRVLADTVQWRREMDALAQACGWQSYADYQARAPWANAREDDGTGYTGGGDLL